MAKILVIDADADARELMVFALRFAGHQMKSALSVEECIDIVKQFSPELIMIDEMFPDIGGIEPIRYLKSNEVTASIPLVVLATNPVDDDSTVEKNGKADYFLQKSMTPDQITDQVHSIIRRLR